jgi:hypothetical protein
MRVPGKNWPVGHCLTVCALVASTRVSTQAGSGWTREDFDLIAPPRQSLRKQQGVTAGPRCPPALVIE